jgi:hypothetical protein
MTRHRTYPDRSGFPKSQSSRVATNSIDHYIDASAARHDAFREPAHRSFIRHVDLMTFERGALCKIAGSLFQRNKFFLPAIRHNDAGGFLQKRQRHRLAQAARSSGNHYSLSSKSTAHWLFLYVEDL